MTPDGEATCPVGRCRAAGGAAASRSRSRSSSRPVRMVFYAIGARARGGGEAHFICASLGKPSA